ncbi:hypothetical protein P8625_01735 [Tenacibaculum tangerinum]|uniref:DUF5017 domain-containing protein n=1 Tax=Tenacibaculum tangerinum TaxID=3038772 RepID=A0ABY8L398_9FLAO|nr:hypothetical protein [Tenacibaculum tangerinum]WGH75912.1 hypothetical protein P8625_01735 [Tenacibaculum tangerinum]
MRYKKIILILPFLLLACSSDEDPITEPQEDSLAIELVTSKALVAIDEVVSFQVKANKPFSSITYSTDNFTTFKTVSKSLGDSFGTSLPLYVNTANIGVISYSIRVEDDAGKKASSTISFTIEKGNAVHLKEVLVNSFYDKDNTWDTEFSNTDPNRLADVFFFLQKPQIGILSGQLQQRPWFESSVKENQGDLTWNLSQKELYVNPNATVEFALADDDGGGIGQDLLLGPPYGREIDLSLHRNTKPSNITLEDISINLNVDFGLEW